MPTTPQPERDELLPRDHAVASRRHLRDQPVHMNKWGTVRTAPVIRQYFMTDMNK